MTTVRAATTDDLPALVTMAQHFLASIEHYGATIPSDEAHLTAISTLVFNNSGTVFLAEHDGAAVGMLAGLLYPHFLTGQRHASEIVWWVEPGARGKDAADALLQAFEVWAKAAGAVRTELGSRHKVLDRFYSRRGYAPAERTFSKDL